MKITTQIISKVLLPITCIIIFIVACSKQTTLVQTKNKIAVNPPFKNITIPFKEYIVQPDITDTMVILSGTQIVIPKGSLIDSLGNTITEPVRISYREFMSPSDILISGIPMNYNSKQAKLKEQFTSAGMFELKAQTETGKPVLISSTNPITVNLASNNSQLGYSSFYLDEATGQWIYSGEEKLYKNLDKINLNKQIEKLKESTAFGGKNYFVLNTSSLLDIYFKNDYNKISPYYSNKKTPLPNKLLKYGVKASNLYCNYPAFINKSEEAASFLVWENLGGKTLPEFKQPNYTIIKHLKGNLHVLKVLIGKKDTFQTKIKSVMRINHLLKFEPEYWTSNSKEAMAQIKKDEIRMSFMNDVYRTMRVNSFGVYNCDKFYSDPNMFVINAKFNLPVKYKNQIPEIIYYLSTRDNALLTYGYSNVNSIPITLVNDPTAKLFTILEGNIVVEIPTNTLMEIKKDENKTQEQTFTFIEKKTLKSKDDVEAYLKKLIAKS